MSPEAPAKKGCCFGGCLGVMFWLGLTFGAGWYVCNLEHNGWQFQQAAADGYNRVGNHVKNAWDLLAAQLGKLTGKDETPEQKRTKAVPPIPNTTDWIGIAQEKQKNAGRLLKSAEGTTGEKRAQLMRLAQTELQVAYSNYVKAEQVDSGNQELLKKISEIGKLLEQLNQR